MPIDLPLPPFPPALPVPALRFLFGCLPMQVNIQLMLINKRCYQSFIPPVITALSIFAPKLLRLFEN